LKKRFVVTQDSSFTHVKDKMYHSVTEHIIQDDQTKELYHYVVSYGSSFSLSHSSVLMSHLLSNIGLAGFGLAYSADNSKIVLPYYPYHMPKTQTIVQIPQNVSLNQISFDRSKKRTSESFNNSFLGKKYIIHDSNKKSHKVTGEDLLKPLFGCYAFQVCEFTISDKICPFYCVMDNMSFNDKKELKKFLSQTDVLQHKEIKDILSNFVKLDIKKEGRI
jgi:hypothetical protein